MSDKTAPRKKQAGTPRPYKKVTTLRKLESTSKQLNCLVSRLENASSRKARDSLECYHVFTPHTVARHLAFGSVFMIILQKRIE